jgi:hypothetical protein
MPRRKQLHSGMIRNTSHSTPCSPFRLRLQQTEKRSTDSHSREEYEEWHVAGVIAE